MHTKNEHNEYKIKEMPQCRPQSNILKKFAQNTFGNFPKFYSLYFLCFHYACSSMNNFDVKFYSLNVPLAYLRYKNRSV